MLEQVNKINHRREFFRADLTHIRQEIEALGLSTKWTMTAAATEFRETQLLEAKMKANPELKRAWVKRQLQLELLSDFSLEPLTPEPVQTPGTPAAGARQSIPEPAHS